MQPIIITAFFTKNSIPIETLTPSIKIRKVSNKSLVVSNELMINIGDGQYAYSFSNAEINEVYTIVCDGGSDLSNSERYSYTSCETPSIELTASFNE